MSNENAGQDSLPNDAMNGNLANGGQQQRCNGGAAGEHGGGIAGFGCGIFPFNWGHQPAKAPQTVTVTKTLSPTAGGVSTSSRAVASASSLAKSSASSRIPTTAPSASAIPNSVSPQSIISLFSSASASPRPSPVTSIRSTSASASASSEVSITVRLSTSSTSKQSSSMPLSSLAIPIPASSQSPKGISTILTSKLSSTTSTSTLLAAIPQFSSSAAAATFVTALSITAPYPYTLSQFFPKPTTGAKPLVDVLPQGLGPESATGQQASQEGGIIAGVLLGVIFFAFILVAYIYTRWRRKQANKEHRRSIGSLSLNGDLRGNDDWDPEKDRDRDFGRVMMPAPAFAPLRANRSSSLYSSSILNALSEPVTPDVPPRNPKRGLSLDFGFDSGTSEPYSNVQRSASEPKRGLLGRERNAWRKEKTEQWPRTIEDFRRSRNMGENMRRGRPLSEGEKTVYTVVAPDFRDEDEMEVKVYKESSWGGNNPFADPNKRDSGKGGFSPSKSPTRKTGEPEVGILHIGIRGSDTRGAWRSSGWKDSGQGKETRGGGASSNGGYGGYGDWKDRVVVEERAVDEVSVFSEAERYEEMRKGYRGKIRFGMGVQRRFSGESRVRDMV
ncbi:hypothetical protein BDZ45DRAFT_292092 [Acephala macrosclerotiorum]|nr:hypothetical protein BDZ45DRAFT_292092 [Acephala macrosclerotiorum]